MATPYSTAYNGAYPFTDVAPQFALAIATELTYTVPGTSATRYRVEFTFPYNASVWVAINATATVPTAGTMSSNSRVQLNPKARFVQGGDVIHFISTLAVADAGMTLLQIPSQ